MNLIKSLIPQKVMSLASMLVITHSSAQLAAHLLRSLERSKGGKTVKNCKGGEKVTKVTEKLRISAQSDYLPVFLLLLYHSLYFLKKSDPDSKNLRQNLISLLFLLSKLKYHYYVYPLSSRCQTSVKPKTSP